MWEEVRHNKVVLLAVGAVITTSVSALGSLALSNFSKPQLTYTLVAAPPEFTQFARVPNTSIYSLVVKASGKSEVKRARYSITFPGGTIITKKVNAPEALEYSAREKPSKDSYLFIAPVVNSGDRVTMSFLVTRGQISSGLPVASTRPTVDIRGDGVRGRSTGNQPSTRGALTGYSILLFVLSLLILAVALAMTLIRERKAKSRT